MNWISKFQVLKNFLKLIVIILFASITFLSVEFGYRVFKEFNNTFNDIKYVALYQSGNNIQNVNDFVKYYPNTAIRSLGLYSKTKSNKTSDVTIEYDYDIFTNNAGLVMQNDLQNGEEVIYIIGDSYTEGLGASPWFYNMEESYKNTNAKLINLAILGTGPMQWTSLEKYITQKFKLNIKGFVINIIPNDMTRQKWVLSKDQLKCLRTGVCNYDGGLQGFDFEAGVNMSEVKDLMQAKFIYEDKKLRDYKDFLRQSHVIVDIYSYLTQYRLLTIRRNEQALLDFKRASQNKIFVNVVSEKSINSKNFHTNSLAKNLVEFLEDHEFNYRWCDINPDGFHKLDSHPNEKGYATLQKCTQRAIAEMQN